MRNQGASGIVDIARDYFYQSISLDDYLDKLSSPDRFAKFLDDHTHKLLNAFPADGKSWGAARKGLNLFFREAVYNKFISDHYKLPTDLNAFNKLRPYLLPTTRNQMTSMTQLLKNIGAEKPAHRKAKNVIGQIKKPQTGHAENRKK